MAFRAKFESSCGKCGRDILKGHWVRKSGSVFHYDCENPTVAPWDKAPAPSNGEAANLLKRAIEEISRKAIDEDRVQALISKALDEFASENQTRTLTVQVADAPAVELEGRQHVAFGECLELAANRQEILMIGPAGCGKTHLASQVAKALGLRFASISCSAGMSEGQLTGRLIPTGEAGRFEYQRSQFVEFYEEGGVFLLDEIDAADPNVLLVINQALANGHLPVPNRIDKPQAERHPDFILIAAANTFGTGANRLYVGRNQLDEATLDRFRIGQVVMDYDRDLERGLLEDGGLLRRLWGIREKVQECGLRRVVSSRFVRKAAIMRAAGWSEEKILDKLTSGWTQDEKSKVGFAFGREN
jgi:cobaltochelatase CobS